MLRSWMFSNPRNSEVRNTNAILCVSGLGSSVQLLSRVQLFATPWTAARQTSLSITNSWSLLKLMSFESVMPSNHLILCHHLLLLTSIFPRFRVFQMSQLFTSGGQRIGLSASASVLPMNIQDWFPLGLTGWISLQSKSLLKSLLQHRSSKASIIWCSAVFIVQLSHSYMTAGKTMSLTRWTFVGEVMSLLFSMLSRLLIAFLPRSKRFFNFMAAVTICSDFGAQENKVCHCFHCLPIYLPWSDGTGCHDLRFLNVEF